MKGLNIRYKKNGQIYQGFFPNEVLKDMYFGNPEIFEMKFYLRYDAEIVAVTSFFTSKPSPSDRRTKKRTQGRYALDNTHTSLMIDKWATRAIRQSQAR